jgi:predicted DNA-binding transcriptional regulator AlpA
MPKNKIGRGASDTVSSGLGQTKVVLGDFEHKSGRGRSSSKKESSPSDRSLGSFLKDGFAQEPSQPAGKPASGVISKEELESLIQHASLLKRLPSSSGSAPRQSLDAQFPADTTPSPGGTTLLADAQAQAGNLVLKVLLLEQEIDGLFASLKDLEASIRVEFTAASLRSVEEVMEKLNASESQVYRWTKSGELRAAWLDRRPRYRPQDIQEFIDSRVKMGKPLNQAKKATPGKASVQNMKKRLS